MVERRRKLESHYIEVFKRHLLPPLGSMMRNKEMSVLERCRAIKHLADGSLAIAASGAEWSAALLQSGRRLGYVDSIAKLFVRRRTSRGFEKSALKVKRRGRSLVRARLVRQLRRQQGSPRSRVCHELKQNMGFKQRFLEDETIQSRVKTLQGLIPGGNQMNCSVLLTEAADYMMFLRFQVGVLKSLAAAIELGSELEI